MYLFVLLPVTIVYGNLEKIDTFWYKTYVTNSIFNNNNAKTINTDSKIQCAVETRIAGKSLFGIKNSQCQILSYEEIPEDEPSNPSSSQKCWTTFTSADCVISPGNVEINGSTFSYFCDQASCLNGEIVDIVIPESPAPQDTCPESFELIDKLGCIQFNKNEKSWCESRKDCLQKGADLMTVDTPEVLEDVRKFVDDSEEEAEAWSGLFRVGPQWKFILGNIDVPIASDYWRPGEPNAGNDPTQCARLKDNAFADRGCLAVKYPYICEIPLK